MMPTSPLQTQKQPLVLGFFTPRGARIAIALLVTLAVPGVGLMLLYLGMAIASYFPGLGLLPILFLVAAVVLAWVEVYRNKPLLLISRLFLKITFAITAIIMLVLLLVLVWDVVKFYLL